MTCAGKLLGFPHDCQDCRLVRLGQSRPRAYDAFQVVVEGELLETGCIAICTEIDRNCTGFRTAFAVCRCFLRVIIIVFESYRGTSTTRRLNKTAFPAIILEGSRKFLFPGASMQTENNSSGARTSAWSPESGSSSSDSTPTKQAAVIIHVDGVDLEISQELYEWLAADSQDRGVSLEQAYQDEMEARRELQRITPSDSKLKEMIRKAGAPDYLADERPGACPF